MGRDIRSGRQAGRQAGRQPDHADRQTSMLLVCRGEKAEEENGEEELSCEQEMERTEVELAAARRQILALERQLSAVTNSEESEPSRYETVGPAGERERVAGATGARGRARSVSRPGGRGCRRSGTGRAGPGRSSGARPGNMRRLKLYSELKICNK